MINMLTWHAPSNNGVFQKETEFGTFSDLLTVKPTFSFSFTNMNYMEQSNLFDIDGVRMTDAQQAEVLSVILETEVPLSWYKQVKQSQLSGTYKSSINSLIGLVDGAEMVSWSKQEAEARAYIADNTVATPILSVLVVSRGLGETVAQLANKIIAKADEYATSYASILGIYQAKQKQLDSATTVAEVQAI
jgi:hypothetical protein